MRQVHRTMCRICTNSCALRVEIEDNLVVKVQGDPEDPLFGGYSCVKGRVQGSFLRDPSRLLHSLKRQPDGSYVEIPVDKAMDEIADRVAALVERDGPRAIAGYSGTMAAAATSATSLPMGAAFLRELGSAMHFTPTAIDKGGKLSARSMLGFWNAPPQGFDRPEAILLLGINPLVTYTGFPAGSPGAWLRKTLSSGCRLIVIDPRRTEVAAKAHWHLQARPGHDVPIVATMIRTILAEGLADLDFCDRHVTGMDRIQEAVSGFVPDTVAHHAGIDVDDLVAATRAYASARRGYSMAGTGPSMSGCSTLVEYLLLVLDTLCGRWLRAGERLPNRPVNLPPSDAYADVRPPDDDWRIGEAMRVRQLHGSRAGLPTAALPEEILTPGPGRVRALISWGGNPAVAFPDQRRTLAALDDLELLVQVDPWMSATARRAHYVIAPTMPLEVAASNMQFDFYMVRNVAGYGTDRSYAHYTPAIVTPPEGSDLIEEWEFFHGLMIRLNLPVTVVPHGGTEPVGIHGQPTTTELIKTLSQGSRVPFDEVAATPGGRLFETDAFVQPGRPDRHARLDVGNARMLQELLTWIVVVNTIHNHRMRLVCRRDNHTYNTSAKSPLTDKGVPYNPAYMSPGDLDNLGIAEGESVWITSATGRIPGVAHADPSLRMGVVSMTFGYGLGTDSDREFRTVGSSPSRLVAVDDVFDPFTGQPQMSNVPVTVNRMGAGGVGSRLEPGE